MTAYELMLELAQETGIVTMTDADVDALNDPIRAAEFVAKVDAAEERIRLAHRGMLAREKGALS